MDSTCNLCRRYRLNRTASIMVGIPYFLRSLSPVRTHELLPCRTEEVGIRAMATLRALCHKVRHLCPGIHVPRHLRSLVLLRCRTCRPKIRLVRGQIHVSKPLLSSIDSRQRLESQLPGPSLKFLHYLLVNVSIRYLPIREMSVFLSIKGVSAIFHSPSL